MKVKVTYGMDIGHRENQEDAIRIDEEVYQEDNLIVLEEIYEAPAIFTVCDGMGGHESGEVASLWCAKESIKLKEATNAEDAQRIIFEIQKTSEKVLPHNSGTTVVAASIKNNKAIITNAGDSRAYLYREGKLTRISHDHSVVQELLDKGEITEEEAFKHSLKNLITLGIGPAFFYEWEKKRESAAFSRELILKTNDVILLCSDGLTDSLPDAEIERLLRERNTNCIKELLYKAKNNTFYSDNISIILMEIL
ncbi:protein phosphatase [Thermosulfidibacter takaii ABI70S6]|uniref:Protein phosphatase n=1 Tax=Thermosulfidibacter takaii (strain DSM 17441 / JCM 13301 / NBRC 103674 / ABI70S6) TaxID=1298851 RepID=A0A0S3QSU6_THET7|nr:protein phosphatase 2C domain-containing protein [Thermosulfidibacter takaii]BAT71397.1 protein phosphatase [Thermosulfidibacter takaii ABI70S6]